MYFTLGNIKFSGGYGPSELTETPPPPRYAELPLNSAGVVLQRTGSDLARYTFSVYLHFSFVNVSAALADLRTASAAGEILPFAAGDGTGYGNFVITSLSIESVLRTDAGGLAAARAKVELAEYLDPDPEATRRREAFAGAVAIRENGIIPVRVAALPDSPAAETVKSVTAARSGALAAKAEINRAAILAPERTSLLARTQTILANASAEVSEAVDAVQKMKLPAAELAALRANFDAIANGLTRATNAAKTGNIAAAELGATDAIGSADIGLSLLQPHTIRVISRQK